MHSRRALAIHRSQITFARGAWCTFLGQVALADVAWRAVLSTSTARGRTLAAAVATSAWRRLVEIRLRAAGLPLPPVLVTADEASRGLGAGGRSVYLIFVVVLLRAWPLRLGTFFVVKRGGVGDADDQAILSEKPGHRLSPRLGAGRVQ